MLAAIPGLAFQAWGERLANPFSLTGQAAGIGLTPGTGRRELQLRIGARLCPRLQALVRPAATRLPAQKTRRSEKSLRR